MIGRNSESEIVRIIKDEDDLRSYGCFIDGAGNDDTHYTTSYNWFGLYI